ncbi:hypothetical protein HZR84_14495 [Hyphobacterium sp. CCMP332]|nr:hypothetical protein HZR84_14495 [Hyphobacterium sp. CCMP332]
MKFKSLHIVLILVMVMLLSMSSCSKKCQVNGCRVRMEHRHSGEKFKSKIRPWYAFQNPRVGRDYKRDKSPDKIPWDGPDIEGAEARDMLVSNDSSDFGGDEFMDDEFYVEDSLGGDNFAPEDENLNKKQKKKKRKGEEEEEVKKEPAGDPWDIENIKEEDPVIRKPVNAEKKTEVGPEESNTEELKERKTEDNQKETKEEQKEKKKSKKQIAKEREERLKKELQEEEEEEDDWGF